MSNPLLRPNDPRFQKPALRDDAGKNRFGDNQPSSQTSPPADEVFASTAAEEGRPFLPRYEVQQQPRTGLLFLFGGLAWAAAVVGAISLTKLLDLGWISPLIGIIPGGAAWFLAHEELKAIRVGAISEDARSQTRHAFWLGLTALLACLAVVAAMIYRQMHFLPDVF